MVTHVKVLATKSEDLSVICETIMEGKTNSPKLSSDFYMCATVCAYPNTYTPNKVQKRQEYTDSLSTWLLTYENLNYF